MVFASAYGVSGIRLENKAFSRAAGVGIFQPFGKRSFFKQQSVYGFLEKQARNKGPSSARWWRRRPPCEIAQGRSRTPAFRRRPIAAGWDGIFSGSTEAAVSRTKSEQNQARSSRGIFESRLPRPSRRIPTQSAAAPLHGYYDCYRYLPFAGPLQNDRTISLQPGIPK
jgi:hypothetical protein